MRLSKEQVANMIHEYVHMVNPSLRELSKQYGVSHIAIRGHLKRNNIPMPKGRGK